MRMNYGKIYEEFDEIPISPRLEMKLWNTALDHTEYKFRKDLLAEDPRTWDDAEDICDYVYDYYDFIEDVIEFAHRESVNNVLLLHHLRDIMTKNYGDGRAIFYDDHSGCEPHLEYDTTHDIKDETDIFLMGGFLKYKIYDIIMEHSASEKPAVHSYKEYITKFLEYYNDDLESIRNDLANIDELERKIKNGEEIEDSFDKAGCPVEKYIRFLA